MATAVIAVGLIAALVVFPTEPGVRWTGLVMQLLGIGTVIWEISETRALFGHPSIRSTIKDRIDRFPLRRRDAVIHAMGNAALAMTGKARAHGFFSAGPEATDDRRIEALERNIEAIHQRITGLLQEFEAETVKGTKRIDTEAQARQAADDSIRDRLEVSGTGGLHISAIGASWLLIGVTLSTASPEIARWFLQ